jgi:UDP-GlcNAc3NAcA epimerase
MITKCRRYSSARWVSRHPPQISGTNGRQTAQALERIEQYLLESRPNCVLVYGDTNSTLAGALAACKLKIPLAHVEAGLRSFNRSMPEEHNRVLTDHCSDFLFCPTEPAVRLLASEGITAGVHWVGDVMYEAVITFAGLASRNSNVLSRLGVEPGRYLLATVHRQYNTDHEERLREIMGTLASLGEPVIFPVHPRTKKKIEELNGAIPSSRDLRLIEPLGYLDMLVLEKNARMILTDSGGVQKEAYFFHVPCVTLRPETEWMQTVESGWNVLVGSDGSSIRRAVHNHPCPGGEPPGVFGSGNASALIVSILRGD